MTSHQAHSAVTTSAMIVAGIFIYRHFNETTGQAQSASTDQFLLGFMVVYIVLSALAEAAPAVGGMLAYLIALGDLLTNGQALVKDLNQGLGETAAATTTTRR